MTQTEIKKYRRIVTLEQAKQVHANIANPAVRLMITPEVVKMIIEADAEVIEVYNIREWDTMGEDWVHVYHKGGKYGECLTIKKEQFNAEWEKME